MIYQTKQRMQTIKKLSRGIEIYPLLNIKKGDNSMYYVSSKQRNGTYGITDTEDGVTEYYTAEQIISFVKDMKLKIDGVRGTQIKPVSIASIMQNKVDDFADILRRHIDCYSTETCYDIGRAGGFKRELNALGTDIGAIRQCVYSHLYTKQIQDVMESARSYTRSIQEVEIHSAEDVKNALMNSVCLVLQLSTKGNLTNFICTGNMNIINQQYGVGFFPAWYIAKTIKGYADAPSRVRFTKSERKKNPALLNVFSGSLRIRDMKNYAEKEFSSPFYSVNTERICCIFKLVEPQFPQPVLTGEFAEIFNAAKESLASGVNMKVEDWCDGTEGFEITAMAEKVAENYDFIRNIERIGCSWGNK